MKKGYTRPPFSAQWRENIRKSHIGQKPWNLGKTRFRDFDSYWTPESNSGCWLWTGAVDQFGYGSLTDKTKIAHRRSWELYRGEIPKGMCVLHHCDVPSCVNPDHLFLGTRRDNNSDRDGKGRHVRLLGENHGMSKLNAEIVRRIRKDSRYCVDIAETYGVNPSTIQRVKRGETWRHIS